MWQWSSIKGFVSQKAYIFVLSWHILFSLTFQLSRCFLCLYHFRGILLGITVDGYTDQFVALAWQNLGDEIKRHVQTLL